MYNPSKKVTELLSQYLEFDPEELRVGIWSGDLSLRNVHLREEAVYPLLNQLQNTNGLDREYQKPPLRFKLLSGTIGSFDLKIPWKSLVWGNGDVRVKLRDVVLVLALETRDETRERLRSRKRRRAATTSMANGENDSCDGVLSLDDEILFGFTEDEENELPGEDPELRKSRRDKKQHNLREAERRALQGRPLGPWLALLKKKADAERAKSLENESSQRLEKESSRLDKWLRGTINDFFWRFLAGLQMEVESFKIVLVQDGVEIGFSIPSISVVPGQQSAKKPGQADSQRRGKEAETANAASALVASAPPEGVVYRGTCDDGEHVDKRIKFTQVGIYVRKQAATFPFSEPMHAAADISTKEFILRPVDLDFSFALFFPYGPAKRKKKINRKREPDGRDAGMQSVIEEPVASISEDTGSSMSSKRRRGKREKSKEVGLPGEAPETSSFLGTDQLTEQTTDQMTELFTLAPSSSPKDPGTPLAASESGPRARIKMNLPSATPEKGHRPRRSSLYGPILATSIAKPAPSIPRGRTVTLPLARPQDMESTTAVVKNRARANDLSARIEGEMNVGSVQLVCSTNHVELLCAFLTGGARLRNGRPSKTIRSVLNQGQALRRSLTITAPAAAIESTGRGPPNSIMSDLEGGETRQFRLELRSARTERSEVIEAWWRYATGAVVWELRQRRRIRRAFQEKFLSFNWERQSYKRDEYVQLFIRHCLMKQTPSPSEEQLEIEDELAIEQILLYRSLARAVHVRGETQFPESILDLKSSQNQQFLSSDEKMSTPLSPPQNPLASKKSADMSRIGDRPGALGRLEVQGEICRQRKQTAEGESLPPNNPYVPWSSMEKDRHSQCDEISFATTKTTETMATAMLNPALIDDSSAMLFSFGIRVSEIELLIVEDEMFPAGSTPIRDDMDDKSQVSMTDVSVLTDDFRYDRIDRDGLIDTESIDEPIMSSTDYLLFSTPEKVLLRIVISPLDLSSVGTVGQFVSLNFSVQQIEALGESGRLFTVGAKDIEPSSSSAQSQKQPPRKAVSISLVRKKGAEGTSLQCDAATVHITPDFKTTQKLTVFASLGSLHLPSSVLQISPREEVRLYVLRQSFQSVFSQINASARIHGLEVVLPFKVLSSNDSSELFARTGPVLRLGMLEMYSGATVYLLDFDATGPSTNEHRSGTRKLRMIEGTDLATATTPLSHKWVSVSIAELHECILG